MNRNTGYNRGVHSQLTMINFITADKAIVAGDWTKLGYYEVGQTEKIGLGYGAETGFNDAQGRVYGLFKDTDGNTLEGEIKIVIEDTQGNTIDALPFNMTMDYLKNGADNLRDRVEYAFQNLILTRERRITLYIKPITVGAAGLFDVSESKLSMSVTRVSL